MFWTLNRRIYEHVCWSEKEMDGGGGPSAGAYFESTPNY